MMPDHKSDYMRAQAYETDKRSSICWRITSKMGEFNCRHMSPEVELSLL